MKLRRILYLLFFVSGAVGLLCQVVWTRWLTGVLGSASSATAIVLAVFMGGLGTGSWLAARYGPRCQRPVRAYAFLEWGVAVLVLLPQLEMKLLEPVVIALAAEWGPASSLLNLVRLVAAVVSLGPPTVLMGATLPLVVQALRATDRDDLGRVTAAAYTINTFGGAVATVLTGFVLIETLGLQASAGLACLLALACGTGAYCLDRALGGASENHFVKGEPEVDRAPYPTGWILAASAATGYSGLGYETIWSRVLSLLTFNTTYAFSLMLAVVLTGIVLGSLLIRFALGRTKDPAFLFAVLQTVQALFVVTSLRFTATLSLWVQALVPVDGWLPTWFGQPLLLTLCLVLVPACLMGASLPVVCTLYGRYCSGSARPVGHVFGANTLGSVLGALVTGLVVIPLQGTWKAAAFCAVLAIMCASAQGRVFSATAGRRKLCRGMTFLAGAVVVVTFLLPSAIVPRGKDGREETLLFQQEDAYGLVEVTEQKGFGVLDLRTNRLHSEGTSSSRGVDAQRRQGLLPMLLHPDPRKVLEIGLGTGIKSGAVEPDKIESVTAVELSPAVIEASRYLAPYSRNPEVRVVCADGRQFVACSPEQYDIISTGVLTPYRAGVARLYTVEHFENCRSHLRPGGLLVVWIAMRQIALEDLKVVVRTLQRVMPNVSLWLDGHYLAFVARPQPYRIRIDQVQTRARHLQKALAASGTVSPEAFLAMHVAGHATLATFAGDGPLQTEDHPLIEFRTPRLGAQLNSLSLSGHILESLLPLWEPIEKTVAAAGEDRACLERFARAHQLFQKGLLKRCRDCHEDACRLFREARRLNPDHQQAGEELCAYEVMRGQLQLGKGRPGSAVHAFKKALDWYPRSIPAVVGLAALAEVSGDKNLSVRYWERAYTIDPHNRVFREQRTGRMEKD